MYSSVVGKALRLLCVLALIGATFAQKDSVTKIEKGEFEPYFMSKTLA